MCGIAGFIAARHERVDRSWLRLMCDRLSHRGPDAYGEFFDDRVALGHRRLSIIDVAGGAQPLGNEDGSIQITFNGEIYNFVELRQDLEKKGHVFATRCDTEVIVHLYEEVGERVPEYLNGMFAFAIWDRRQRKLLLCRDRFGKKPLYYSERIPGFRFCFASELKSLTVLPAFDRPVDRQSVADFLAFSYVPDPRSIYEDVHRVPPAHSLVVTESGVRIQRYWTPPFGGECEYPHADAIEALRAQMADAVRCRMISDVPLGAFLSGGVDSSSVVALMAQTGARVNTFSIGFTEKNFDELPFARLVVERYGTEHREEVVSLSIGDVLGKLIETFDEPFGDSSAVPMLYLSRMTRKHVTVALSGDGADELFGGYRRYIHGVFEERLRRCFPAWFRDPVFRVAGQYYPKLDYMPQVFRAKTLLGNLARTLSDAYFTSMTAFRDEALERILSPGLLGGEAYSPRDYFRKLFHDVRELTPLEQMQAVDLQTYLPGDILVKADRATMAYSLESRSPLLDYRLGEIACKLPSALKVRFGTGKHILKQAVRPYVPAEVIDRRKMGFQVPLARWFRTSLKSLYQQTVLRDEMESYIRTSEARRLFSEHQSGRHDHSRKLWNLLMLALWDAHHQRSCAKAEVQELVSAV